MEVGVLVGGRGCQCGAVRAGVRLATVRWCRLHRSSATDAQNQTPAALPLCQVSPFCLISGRWLHFLSFLFDEVNLGPWEAIEYFQGI